MRVRFRGRGKTNGILPQLARSGKRFLASKRRVRRNPGVRGEAALDLFERGGVQEAGSVDVDVERDGAAVGERSEEHTSELQSR